MVSPVLPSTPNSVSLNGPPVNIPPGTWRHPKFDEIARRQNQSTFTDRNLKKILWNGGILLFTWAVGWGVRRFIGKMPQLPPFVQPLWQYTAYPVLLLRIMLIINMLIAMLPVIRPKDDLIDIPLTPSQRALLGLNPNATPQGTPTSQYSTPPRYPRSSTPRSGNSEGRASNYSSSPLSGKGSPSLGKNQAESVFSPTISPLLQRAITGGGRDTTKRRSSGLSSPQVLDSSIIDSSVISLPSTPSPSNGKGVGIGLNNRWLYERSRQSPMGPSVYS